MDWSYTVNNTWKLCFIGSLLACFVLLLFLNQNGKTLSFSFAELQASIAKSPVQHIVASHGVAEAHTPNTPVQHSVLSPTPNMLTYTPVQHTVPNMLTYTPVQHTVPSPTPVQHTVPSRGVDVAEAPGAQTPSSSIIAKSPVQDFALEGESGANTIVTISPSPLHSTINETSNFAYVISNEEESTNNSDLQKSTNKSINGEKKCNIFDGKWVYKPEQNPAYDKNKCPFIEEKMSCQNNGRPDSDYQKWRWEAKDCDIPLFNGKEMLERLRNKRVIIVGDSLNRNMWESLACLLYSSIPSKKAQVQAQKPEYKVLKAKDYNAIIEFHWSPFLTEYDPNHESGKKVLVLDKLSPNSRLWKGADVMVFNSAHWWTHRGKLQKWELLEYQGQLLEKMALEQAYEVGMKTWAKWIEENVDPKKTRVFFRSVSAQHNGKPYCYDVSMPITNETASSYINLFPKTLIQVIESVIKEMRKLPTQVNYLNITKLSEYRIDAHPSVYRTLQWKLYTTKYQSLIPTIADCSHWCLPGLPDTWNQLLYASLFFDTSLHMSIS